ncbi:hypothetical protein ACJ41O_014324 [Fusarium nematophilum]
MANLLSLPNEILECVCVYASDIDHAVLFQIAHVNKRLYKIVSPLLVRRWCSDGELPECRPIMQLALRLLHHPELRARVEDINFGYLSILEDHVVNDETEGFEDLATAAVKAWPALVESTDWSSQLRDGVPDATATLLLCWATKLTNLELHVPRFNPEDRANVPWNRSDFLFLLLVSQVARRLREGQTSAPLPLLELRRVVFRHCDDEGGVWGRYAAPFFYLPNMRTFYGFKVRIEEYEGYEEDSASDPGLRNSHEGQYLTGFPFGTSPIEEVILEDANVSPTGLEMLVRACRRMKALVFQPGKAFNADTLSLNGLARIILIHSASLERLVLDFELVMKGDFVEDPDDGPVRLVDCFKSLHHLESLTMSPDYLFEESFGDDDESIYHIRHDRLPPSLKHLRLQDDDRTGEDYFAGLESLLRECKPDGKLPIFHTLDVSDLLMEDDPSYERVIRLRDLCKAHGVKLAFNTTKYIWEGCDQKIRDLGIERIDDYRNA